MASLSKRDLEDLKPAVDETLRQVLDMLTPLLEDSAPKFVESLFTTISRKQAEIKTRKRSALKDDEFGKPKRKKFSHFSEEDDIGLSSTVEDPGASQLSSAQIKSMMDSARQQIIARKTQLRNVNGSNSSVPAARAAPTHTPSVSETQALVNDAMQKVQRAAEIQARIKASMEATGPTDLILDDLGRTVDARGRVIQLPKFVPTIKANIRAKRREEFKATQQEKPQDINLNSSRFFDPRLSVPEQRTKKTFKFFEQGKFERIAQRIRAKSQLEKLQNEIAQAAKKTGISSATKLALITPKKVTSGTETPNVEWWDSVILKTESYTDLYRDGPQTSSGKGMSDRLTGITHLVEHPIQMRPPAESTKPVEIPIYLTKKERKKLRRQRRREAQREMSEKIRLGLEPPPEPKVRMANLMRVLGTEAVQDPTKVEAHVRAQMEKRQKTHEEANAARKLTDEQRKEKKMRKIKEDTSLGVNVALYRVKDLRNPARKFKVEANCNQLHMTGMVVLHKDVNVVVVEGDDDEDSDEEGETKSKKCVLVWEGMTKERHFGEIRFKQCPTESIARELFKKHNVEHYWDLCHSQAILENADS
ncbi:U4/U6 small nuclear ribonucleoprotein Prp3 [Holothuria leucospilota]|uniref:U4/U6 small nuclear ribonucleoprotein Prp3 n=1 Tax=Holothuria leucospilota TaxID=206669 RepID=A0A9Q1H8H0_HOLLE|nr:U4/U6 small nuclear ribonucleoprotein Prp3 [Holothuria leucospilota]